MEELITMGASASLGFIFKMWSNAQQDKADERKYLLDKSEQTNTNQNDASKRGGVWMQRFTVLVLISLFAYISVGAGHPTNIITNVSDTEMLWGIFSWSNKPIVQTVDGMLYTNTLSLSILAIISYLFGSDTGTR